MPCLVPVEVIELLPLPYSGSCGSSSGKCATHETASLFLLASGPSAMLVSFRLDTLPPRARTPIYVILGSRSSSHMSGWCGYSAACIPGQELYVCQLHCGQFRLVGPLSPVGFLVLRGALNLRCIAIVSGWLVLVVAPSVELSLHSLPWWLSQSEMIYWPFILFLVASQATVPFLSIVVLSLHSTFLREYFFLVLQHCTVRQVLPILVSMHEWLAMLPLVLFKIELRLCYQLCGF